ncbi:MAG TPA: hydrogenase maturation protease [Baekduia sp.]|nr:hydrogenase maturation protease [Baekduia sp.]
MTAARPVAQVLVAGLGNAWLRDDGFGGVVARALQQRALPAGVAVMDAGTSGLDLAYEVLRGYQALVLVDASRQGGAPGTLYVMEPEREEFAAALQDGERIDPHSMDPRTVLRLVRATGGWPAAVRVVACEPAEVDEPGIAFSAAVQAAVEPAVALVLETVAELQAPAAVP